MLPDDVLLKISDFYVDEDFGPLEKQRIGKWTTLAHVCRRWRSVVFYSPRRLNLRLVCTPKSPGMDTLDIWPPLPLVIRNVHLIFNDEPSSMDNTIAALERNDRVCQIVLRHLTSLQMEYVTASAAMRKPFLELTDLHLGVSVGRGPGPMLRESFLGGTAPRLRSLDLYCIPFPGLPKLLLSAPHLVYLSLHDIPPSGYIPPEAMATSLSALTSLGSLRLQFRYPRPRPALESRRPLPPPLTRSILRSLTSIQFHGASEYLEEIWARIDAPRLNKMDITFFNQIIFDTPQLFRFISRRSTLGAPEKGLIEFSSEAIIIKFLSQTSAGDYDHYGVSSLEIRCAASEWQLSSLEQVCTSSLPPVSMLEDLYIFDDRENPPRWQDDVENTLWLELLHPFVAVKNLYLCKKFIPRIAPALQELVGGRTTEVLPTLKNIFLKGFQLSEPLHEGIEKFVAARRLTSHPVAVFRWDWDRRWEFCYW